MFVLLMEEEMHQIGVKSNIYFLSLLSSTLLANDIVIDEINKIENTTLSNGSSITQGGLTITNSKASTNIRKDNNESNNTVSQGVISIDDEKITDIHYKIINIITYTP